MISFSNFSIPLWEIFFGNMLMLVTSVFYMTWWTVSFRPNNNGKTTGAGFFLAVAIFTGVTGIVIMSLGIYSLSAAGNGFPVMYILLGAVACFVILLAITKIAFRRAVTSELLLITIWAALECSAIAALQGGGRFGSAQVLTCMILVALATGIGIGCYILHYRLNEPARFWNGLIPIITDAVVMIVFLVVLSLS
jgi:hypothetical protein